MEVGRVYRKADSLHAVRGDEPAGTAVRGRIEQLQLRLPSLAIDSYRKSIVERACRALVDRPSADEPEYRLRPHVIEELKHVADSELPRYLFYRYRYDVFPITRELDAFPPCVQIEPTSICNYRCVFCYQTDRRSRAWSMKSKARSKL
jgi:hypothetical protein